MKEHLDAEACTSEPVFLRVVDQEGNNRCVYEECRRHLRRNRKIVISVSAVSLVDCKGISRTPFLFSPWKLNLISNFRVFLPHQFGGLTISTCGKNDFE